MDQHQDWMSDTPIEPSSMPGGGQIPRQPRGHAWPAWIVILLICAFSVYLQTADIKATSKSRQGGEDRLDAILMELQGKFLVGEAAWQDAGPLIYEQAKTNLNEGSLGQRQRFIVLAAELAGPKTASEELRSLDGVIEQQVAKGEYKLKESQEAVQVVLHKLYDQDPSDVADPSTTRPATDKGTVHLERLPAADRDLLTKELGWYSKLALVPAGQADKAARDAVIAPVVRLVFIIVGGLFVLGIGAFLGLLGLILLLVFALKGALVSYFAPSPVHHGIYAETFAVWMVLFTVLQIAAGLASASLPSLGLPLVLVAIFASLGALAWPIIRGVPWPTVRRDIGWTLGRQPALEPLIGIGGYCMALPLLAGGVGLTLLLLLVQQHFAPERPPLAPTGNPGHPIIMQLAGDSWWPKIVILFLAAVAAPIVEETMFRGVLYRHLRGATAGAGRAMSIVMSGLVSAFIFAVIHPQGWVAIPALMSLALAFVMLREWRGTLIPCMIVHGISNFLVMSMVILVLRA